MERLRLSTLESAEYEHPLDKATLSILRKTPLLPKLLELIGVPFNSIDRLELLGNNVRITESQFPTLYRLMREACEVLNVNEPLFYISSNPILNAYTSCPDKPIICIHGYLLDTMDDNELLFIIGHELSHIKSKHLIYGMLGDLIRIGALTAILATVPGFGIVAETAIRYAYFQWERAGEYSCDRGGYLACQNFTASCMALMKLAGLSKRHIQELNLEEFIQQGKDFKDVDTTTLGKIQKIILSYSSHPWAVSRVSELIKFNESGQYYNVLQRKTEQKKESLNICSACGSQISNGLKFCGMCGTPVISESAPMQQPAYIPNSIPMSNQELTPIQENMVIHSELKARVCESCGSPNKDNASFCWSCGRAL